MSLRGHPGLLATFRLQHDTHTFVRRRHEIERDIALHYVRRIIGLLSGHPHEPTGFVRLAHYGQSGRAVTPRPGKADFDSASGEYRVTGGGANVWGTADAFQFVSKRVSGDISLQADIHFVGAGAILHRKAMLMIRQGLEPNAVYGDAALHGDGLTSLQYRLEAGAITAELKAPIKAPMRLRIERRGDKLTMFAGKPGEELQPTGPATVVLKDPVYIGLAVCSHNADILETVIFSNVRLQGGGTGGQGNRVQESNISVYDLRTNSVEVIYKTNQHFEAPNWSPDGKYLLLNSAGGLWRLDLDKSPAAAPVKIDLGTLTGCNNDHGMCPAPMAPVARLITPLAPSYYHVWSPDGKWLSFVGQRDKNFDLYRVSPEGGKEERLTSHAGYDDGPDYSPDGKWTYFNSDRSGSWDIWRIPAKGAGKDDKRAQQVTKDEYEDWFPHPSRDGKWLVFISFEKGTKGHPAGQNVVLRMMPMPGSKLKPADIKVITKLYGGQGTMNVNSWAPDSKRFAFVSYK